MHYDCLIFYEEKNTKKGSRHDFSRKKNARDRTVRRPCDERVVYGEFSTRLKLRDLHASHTLHPWWQGTPRFFPRCLKNKKRVLFSLCWTLTLPTLCQSGEYRSRVEQVRSRLPLLLRMYPQHPRHHLASACWCSNQLSRGYFAMLSV